MKTCPKCNEVNHDPNATSCSKCGYIINNEVQPVVETPDSGPDPDFVVTEAAGSTPEFVGGSKQFDSEPDGLSIESNSDLMENEANTNNHQNTGISSDDNEDSQLIGMSEPPPPPLAENPDLSNTSPLGSTQGTGQVRKLSEADVESIEQGLYGSSADDEYLSNQEKSELISKLDKVEDNNKKTAVQSEEKPFSPPIPPPKPESQLEDKPFSPPIPPPKKEKTPKTNPPPAGKQPDSNSQFDQPKMAKKSKGVAYFYKNYIQLQSTQELHHGDDLTVVDRLYMLQAKQFDTKIFLGIAAAVFTIILVFVGAMFIDETPTGNGEVVGLAVLSDGSPYVLGATIKFPEINHAVETNAQGFFRSGKLPAGPQKIEYILDDEIIGVDYVTITEGEISTMVLQPDEATDKKASPRQTSITRPQQPVESVSNDSPQQSVNEQKPSATVAKSTSSKKTTKSNNQKPGKITLAANIDGARLTLDGKVLGAGNLTYSKIKAGTHNYTVSKTGYQDITGKIKIASGAKETLSVELTPLNAAQKEQIFKADDYYQSGVTALKEKDFQTAIQDFSEVIDKEPSHAEAYMYRGEALQHLKYKDEAHNDYVRAAEILQFKNDHNQAITAYNKALEINKKSITAYVGRGRLYLNKNQEIAAIADFQAALKEDKNNFEARFGLGEARFRQGNYKKAVDHFKKARKIDSENPLVYQYLMLSYMGRDDHKNVQKSFDKFKEYASKEQYQRFLDDKKYSAILEILDKDPFDMDYD